MSGATATPILSVRGLIGGYGDAVVLRDIDLQAAPGHVLGVSGRNGVGKTTLMRLLMGYLPRTAGSILWRGEPLATRTPHGRRKLGISYAPQEGVVFDNLTIEENLLLSGNGLAPFDELFASFPWIPGRLRQNAGSLSGGEKKIVSFVRVIAERSDLTLLDEPSEGVQQENIDVMLRHIRQRCAEGAAFILVEQNLDFLLSAMQAVLVLDHGQIVFNGVSFERAVLESFLQI